MRNSRTPYTLYQYKDSASVTVLTACLFDALDDCNEMIKNFDTESCDSSYVRSIKDLVSSMKKVALYMEEKIPTLESIAEECEFFRQDKINIGGIYYDREDFGDW